MEQGQQRLSLERLHAWESLKYGMFIHFGMNTFDTGWHSKGDKPASYYNPDKLDVKQWVSVARDAGMKYAVLTTKHDSGFCLWPSDLTDYSVKHGGNKTDVIAQFVKACEETGIIPAFYYCSWDNHHTLGSKTPAMVPWEDAFTTRAYQDFQTAQIEELLTRYGKVGEVWIDIPQVLPRGYKKELYDRIASLQPDTVIAMNHGVSDGRNLKVYNSWPTDIITIEQCFPRLTDTHNLNQKAHEPWRTVEGGQYYLPGEVCDTVGKSWFFFEGDNPRHDLELLGMYLVASYRGTNCLMNVGPDKHGLIPPLHVAALLQLRKNLDLLKAK